MLGSEPSFGNFPLTWGCFDIGSQLVLAFLIYIAVIFFLLQGNRAFVQMPLLMSAEEWIALQECSPEVNTKCASAKREITLKSCTTPTI